MMRQWYVLKSKPRHESLVSSVLAQSGIETYFPEMAVHREHGKPLRREPFFPGYLFGHLDPERSEIRQASYSPGVVGAVGYGEEPWPVPESVIDYIQQRLSRRNGAPGEHFRSGDRLVITEGPLRGLEAVFDCPLSGTGRVRVLIQILSQLCPAKVHIEQIRRPPQAAKPTVA